MQQYWPHTFGHPLFMIATYLYSINTLFSSAFYVFHSTAASAQKPKLMKKESKSNIPCNGMDSRGSLQLHIPTHALPQRCHSAYRALPVERRLYSKTYIGSLYRVYTYVIMKGKKKQYKVDCDVSPYDKKRALSLTHKHANPQRTRIRKSEAHVLRTSTIQRGTKNVPRHIYIYISMLKMVFTSSD